MGERLRAVFVGTGDIGIPAFEGLVARHDVEVLALVAGRINDRLKIDLGVGRGRLPGQLGSRSRPRPEQDPRGGHRQ